MSLDHYNKIKVVGKGSYGEVWLVNYRRDKKQYVLKKMEIQNASKREKKAAEQEAKLLSKLRHPNIVSYKDSFESDDGHLYIVMGFCDGGDLYNRLKEQKTVPLEEKQVVEWFVQIAMALQYMHERNILHRDLKTQNIFLTKSKIIKVGDLGIARVLEGSNDMATTLIGTPYYMSPELFSNRPYNHKSDVWALGCCVYEMATLKHAFNARDMNSLVYKILRGKMPAMPQRYSNDLIELIKVMLQQSPEKRPSVARILRNPFIKKHIAIFLEGTRARRPSTTSNSESGRRRGSAIGDIKEEGSRPRPSSAGDAKKPSRTAAKKKAASVSSNRPDSGSKRPDSGSKRDGRPGSAGKERPSSAGKEKKVRHPGSDKPVTPRKARPLPTPPTKTGSTPRKSASAARKSTKSASSSASSSVSSSKGESGTPREDDEVMRSVNRSARARRRADQLRESQEQGTPTGPTVRRGSEPMPLHKNNTRESSDSGLGTDSIDGRIQKKTPVERTRSEPGSPSKASNNRHQEPADDSSSEEDEEDDDNNREDKEIDEFSSLLETTLKLDKPSKGEGRDSPEDSSEASSGGKDSPDTTGMIAPPPSEMSSYGADPMNSTRDISIAPAAPRAPRGLGNATMTTSGRLMDRIAILRKDIIHGVGLEVLMKAYDILENEEDGDTEKPLVELMGRPKFELYGAKIWQLKFCEETMY